MWHNDRFGLQYYVTDWLTVYVKLVRSPAMNRFLIAEGKIWNFEYCFRFQQELYRELISIKLTISSVWATESIFLSKMSDIYFCSFTNSFLLSKNIIKNLKFQSNLYDPGPVTNGTSNTPTPVPISKPSSSRYQCNDVCLNQYEFLK